MKRQGPIGLPSDIAVGMLMRPAMHSSAGFISNRVRYSLGIAFGVVLLGRPEVVRAEDAFRLLPLRPLRLARCRILKGSIFLRGLGTFFLLV